MAFHPVTLVRQIAETWRSDSSGKRPREACGRKTRGGFSIGLRRVLTGVRYNGAEIRPGAFAEEPFRSL